MLVRPSLDQCLFIKLFQHILYSEKHRMLCNFYCSFILYNIFKDILSRNCYSTDIYIYIYTHRRDECVGTETGAPLGYKLALIANYCLILILFESF